MANDAQLGIVVKAVDQASATLGRIEKSVQSMEQHTSLLSSSVGRLTNSFSALRSVLSGLAVGAGIAAFQGLERGITDVLRAIPDLINRGKDWLTTVQSMADATGLGAEKASLLAVQARQLEVPVDSLQRVFAQFTKNVGTNAKTLDALGVAAKDSNGNMRDAYSIFVDLNQVLSQTGINTSNAAAVAKLFGRNWAEVSQLLTAQPGQLAAIGQAALQSGQIVSEAQVQERNDFVRTQIALQGAVSGLGTNIFTAVAPALTGLINAIRSAIEANMAAITSFVSQAVGFVVGLLSGLFGLNLNLSNFSAGIKDVTGAQAPFVDATQKSTGAANQFKGAIKGIDDQLRALDRAEAAHNAANQRASIMQSIADARQAMAGGDEYTRSINRQTDAIDRKLAALDKQRNAEQIQQERQQMLQSVQDASAQLADLQDQSIFAAGMSEAERVLAEQKHAQDIIAAQKAVADAKKQQSDFEQGVAADAQRKQLEAQKAALQQQLQMHQQEIASQKQLTDALNRLREFNYQQGIDKRRQELEDQRRHLQDQIDAVKNATPKATKIGKDFTSALFPGLTNQALKNIKGMDGTTGGIAGFIQQGQAFAAQIKASIDSLVTKIGGLVDQIKAQFDQWKPVLDIMGNISRMMLQFLGPGGFVALLLLKQFGLLQPLIGMLTGGGGGAGLGGDGMLVTIGALGAVAIDQFAQVAVRGLQSLTPQQSAAAASALQNSPLAPLFQLGSLAPKGTAIGDLFNMIAGLATPGGKDFGKGTLPVPPMQPSPDSVDRANADANARNLATVATSVSPGGDFFRTLYDNTSAAQDNADSASRSADNSDLTVGKLNAGLNFAPGTTVGMNVPPSGIPVVNGATGFTTNGTVTVPSGLNINNPTLTVKSDSSFQATVVPTSTGFGINVLNDAGHGVPVSPPAGGFGIKSVSPLVLSDGTVIPVKGANGTNLPVVDPSGAHLAQDGTPIPLKGVNLTSGAINIVTTGGNTLDVSGSGPIGNLPLLQNIRAGTAATAGNTVAIATRMTFTNGKLATTTTAGSSTGGGNSCFPIDTPISTPDGDKAIGDIRVGDKVWAVNEETLELVTSEVVALVPHPQVTDRRLMVYLSGGKSIEVTDNHPFYDVALERFHHIAEFSVGDAVLDYSSGAPVERAILAIEDLGNEPKDVYNFEVAVYHNYLANGVLVHNIAKAMGGSGLVRSPTDILMGEAGTEAYAILRNPRAVGGGALTAGGGSSSGGAAVIHTHIYLSEREIATAVTNWQATHARSSTSRFNTAGGSS